MTPRRAWSGVEASPANQRQMSSAAWALAQQVAAESHTHPGEQQRPLKTLQKQPWQARTRDGGTPILPQHRCQGTLGRPSRWRHHHAGVHATHGSTVRAARAHLVRGHVPCGRMRRAPRRRTTWLPAGCVQHRHEGVHVLRTGHCGCGQGSLHATCCGTFGSLHNRGSRAECGADVTASEAVTCGTEVRTEDVE